ncbi:MAG: LPXTG cell wall anchor domain-containing protein [Chloroflexi bacterium]|nr:MAG: LPXTG cell wall anchor domain-containing protein [Chloroflexota bacterium]
MSLDNTPPDENEPDENLPEGLSFDDFRDQYDDEVPAEEEAPPSGGRTFITVVGIIGGIIVLAALALVGYFLFTRGTLATRFQQQAAELNAENTAIAATATDASKAQMTQKAILPPTWTPVPQNTAVQASPTPKPTNTVAVPTADEAAGNSTATAQANLTLSAQGGNAGTPVAQAASPTVRASATSRVSATPLKTATALPQTGFADEVGLPGLLGLALGLVIVVFAARRIRLSTGH